MPLDSSKTNDKIGGNVCLGDISNKSKTKISVDIGEIDMTIIKNYWLYY